MKEDIGAHNPSSKPQDEQADINLVECPQVLAVVEGSKRTRSEVSGVREEGRVKKSSGPQEGGVSLGAEKMDVDQNHSSSKVKTKRLRRPPRRLPVNIKKKDIWERLQALDSGLSMADWLALDKKAYQDVRDGLRYLYGRKPKSTKKGSNQARPVTQGVNAVDLAEYAEAHYVDDNESDDSWLSVSSDDLLVEGNPSDENSEEGEDGYWSDDTVYDYPYNFQRMRTSCPLRGPIIINGQVVSAVFDSGASVSIISKSLVKKLKLQTIGDKIPVSTMDDDSNRPCDITVSVPVRVAGKLRPEHMCIQENTDRDMCLLGMTWFRAYGIYFRADQSTLVIPTGHGQGCVELQCHQPQDPEEDGVSALAVMVAAQGDSTGADGDPQDQDMLRGYQEEVLSRSSQGGEQEEELPELIQLLREYDHCFFETSGLGRVSITEHHINLEKDQPVRSKPYRLTYEEDQYLKDELKKMLELDLIRPASGRWSSPLFFIKKKNGSLRMVIDYRRVNRLTTPESYPLPHIDDLLDSLNGASWFSTLDAASGYWQVPMSEESIEYTSFICKYGVYAFKVMPFGLQTAVYTYQRMMCELMAPYIGQFVFVFVDDLIVFSRSMEEHLEHLKTIFQVCNSANLRLRREKCSFFKRSVTYLGHEVCEQGIKPCSKNVEKALQMTRPVNASEVRSFLGTAGFFRRFIRDYATVAEPLTRLLRKAQAFEWGEKQEEAFVALKNSLTQAPILAFPDMSQETILTTDASGVGIGAILSQHPQDDPSMERVVAYASRTLRGPEKRYATTHAEALAVVWGVHKFRYYLAGRRFTIRTDHNALTFIFNNPNPSAKVQRWAAALFDYDFTVQYRPGVSNPADSLSRLLVKD